MSSTNTGQKLIFTGSERSQYTKGKLEIEAINAQDPFQTFHEWFAHAKTEGITADAVCLSTADLPSGRISSRMVLLKELDTAGFVIYSNFGTSRKSMDYKSNKHASLCFWYEKQERSIRIEGLMERLTNEESQVYFDTRPLGSRLGAWASPQSTKLETREQLDGYLADIKTKFEVDDKVEDKHIPVPDFWGGLRIVPYRIEFWSGRNNRLHDRFAVHRTECDDASAQKHKKDWSIDRLSP